MTEKTIYNTTHGNIAETLRLDILASGENGDNGLDIVRYIHLRH